MPVHRPAGLSAKYVVFVFIAAMTAYVLYRNESFLLDPSPNWSAKASHGLSTAIGPVDSPPVALRWSIVMQRKSFLKASGALMTAVAQPPIREFKPPPGVQSSGKPAPLLLRRRSPIYSV